MADLLDDHPIDAKEMVAELNRELNQRGRVYERLIAAGRLDEDVAKRRNQVLQAIVTLLEHPPMMMVPDGTTPHEITVLSGQVVVVKGDGHG